MEKIIFSRSILLLKGYLLIFLFGFLIFGLPQTPSLQPVDQGIHSNQNLNLLFYSNWDNTIHSPFELPSAPEPENQEKNKNQQKDKVENEVAAQASKAEIAEDLNLLHSETSIFHFISSIQKRQKVSLYILYHSWKSYLP